MIPSSKPVTDAVVALADTVGAAPVGDGTMPTAGDPPFSVVYPLAGGDTWGPDYTAPQSAAAFMYQITTVAVSRASAETHADLVRHAFLDRDTNGAFVTPLPVAGLVVLDRELVSYGGVVSDRGVFNVADTYLIHVTRP
jgi:hypothetical protein